MQFEVLTLQAKELGAPQIIQYCKISYRYGPTYLPEIIQRANSPFSVLLDAHYFMKTHRSCKRDVLSIRFSQNHTATHMAFLERGKRQPDVPF
jgi:hypothetical protein